MCFIFKSLVSLKWTSFCPEIVQSVKAFVCYFMLIAFLLSVYCHRRNCGSWFYIVLDKHSYRKKFMFMFVKCVFYSHVPLCRHHCHCSHHFYLRSSVECWMKCSISVISYLNKYVLNYIWFECLRLFINSEK